MFEIAYGIESGIAIQSAVVVVFSAYLETIQKIGDRMVCPEMFADGMFFYAAVRVGGSGCAMIDSDAGYRIQSDERTVVLTVSGRGDKDIETYLKESGTRTSLQ